MFFWVICYTYVYQNVKKKITKWERIFRPKSTRIWLFQIVKIVYLLKKKLRLLYVIFKYCAKVNYHPMYLYGKQDWKCFSDLRPRYVCAFKKYSKHNNHQKAFQLNWFNHNKAEQWIQNWVMNTLLLSIDWAELGLLIASQHLAKLQPRHL